MKKDKVETKKKKEKKHSKFWSLVIVQLRDKLDLSWANSTKSLIRKIVFSVLSFVLITGIVYLTSTLLMSLKILDSFVIVPIYKFFFVVIFLLNLISTSHGLMKSLYYADDNKVLVTFPVSSSQLFISKLLVYYFFELKKALDLLIPVSVGFFMTAVSNNQLTPIVFVWMLLIVLISVLFTVLLGALLSIPFLFANKFLKQYPISELVLLLIGILAFIIGSIYLINLIPTNINMITEWQGILRSFEVFIKTDFTVVFYPVMIICNIITGSSVVDKMGFTKYVITPSTLGLLGIFIAVLVVLAAIVYFAIKPFYFVMMTKTFEFDKNLLDHEKENSIHKKYVTFANKELKPSFRDFDISFNFILIYVLTPLLLYLINRLFLALDTSPLGERLIATFNVLLILLPLLSSNSLIASMYSKEGRAGYLKKTKPIFPHIPLISKFIFNLIFSIPSIVACTVIFGIYNSDLFNIFDIISIGLMIIFVNYGHMFYSAQIDIMNPLNEIYATEGDLISNPNETKASIIGYAISLLVTLIFFFLVDEALGTGRDNYDSAFIKLLIISIIFFGCSLYLFIAKVRAYYYEK